MSQRELTILVLGRPDRTSEAVERAVAAVRQGGIECDLVSALPAEGPDGAVLDDLVRRCQDALQETCQPILLRLRLSAADVALVDGLTAGAQQDLLTESVEILDPAVVEDAPVPVMASYSCRCDGFGCVCCMGEACP
jgi:hypothetical protein